MSAARFDHCWTFSNCHSDTRSLLCWAIGMANCIFISLFVFYTATVTMATPTTVVGQKEGIKQALHVDHSSPQHHLTHIQSTLLVAFIVTVCLWTSSRLLCNLGSYFTTSDESSKPVHTSNSDSNIRMLESDDRKDDRQGHRSSDSGKLADEGSQFDDVERNTPSSGKDPFVSINIGATDSVKGRNLNGSVGEVGFQVKGKDKDKSPGSRSGVSKAPPDVSFDTFLNKAVLFGAIMAFFYMCDYYKIFPQGERLYSRDSFLFLVFLLFLVALSFTMKTNQDKILNREQTEEWKGWMQVMFVWYHYFRAKEWYNWIRIYIACYVWMTGFGNFSFFWVRKDFSPWRMLKMLFRLNFLVIFVSLTTNNEYMLYYICAMHTYWFLTVYVFMRVLNSWNTDRLKMAVKFAAYAICNAIIFDIPGVSEVVFRPVKAILGRNDDSGDVMHEWSFRAGLDHWACFLGMLCAYNYPTVEQFSNYLDSKSASDVERAKKIVLRFTVGACAIGASFAWYFSFMREDKYAYNALHPYSSMIPILTFIVLRNIHPVFRTHHLGMFTWLGKITLETYLSQLHIYLLGNATSLLVYLQGYPLLNFALATIVYLVVSHCLFSITNDFSSFLIPKDRTRLAKHMGLACTLFLLSSILAYVIMTNLFVL